MIKPTYTYEAMEAAFNNVRNAEDWKAPIKADVELEALGVTIAAIEFYTATPAYFVSQRGNIVTIKSAGYRMGPAGDH